MSDVGPPPLTSALADRALNPRTDLPARTAPVYGVAIHCTGSGIVKQALQKRRDPLEHAHAYYTRANTKFLGHYAIGFDGRVACTAPESARAAHVGLVGERELYLNGRWADGLPAFAAAWRKRWPAYRGPAELYPGDSVNAIYVGIELLVWVDGCPSEPAGPGQLYTAAQYEAAARLCADIAQRWRFPNGWHRSGRLAGHEDLAPINRVNRFGGWDPGITRLGGAAQQFAWDTFVGWLDHLVGGSARPPVGCPISPARS